LCFGTWSMGGYLFGEKPAPSQTRTLAGRKPARKEEQEEVLFF